MSTSESESNTPLISIETFVKEFQNNSVLYSDEQIIEQAAKLFESMAKEKRIQLPPSPLSPTELKKDEILRRSLSSFLAPLEGKVINSWSFSSSNLMGAFKHTSIKRPNITTHCARQIDIILKPNQKFPEAIFEAVNEYHCKPSNYAGNLGKIEDPETDKLCRGYSKFFWRFFSRAGVEGPTIAVNKPFLSESFNKREGVFPNYGLIGSRATPGSNPDLWQPGR